jgi:hypothetical protein
VYILICKTIHNSKPEPMLVQAPLLAYNSFVEVVFSLNRCREGLAATALQSQGPKDAGGLADMSAEDLAPTAGPSPAARAKRDVIYTCAAAAFVPLSMMQQFRRLKLSGSNPVEAS